MTNARPTSWLSRAFAKSQWRILSSHVCSKIMKTSRMIQFTAGMALSLQYWTLDKLTSNTWWYFRNAGFASLTWLHPTNFSHFKTFRNHNHVLFLRPISIWTCALVCYSHRRPSVCKFLTVINVDLQRLAAVVIQRCRQQKYLLRLMHHHKIRMMMLMVIKETSNPLVTTILQWPIILVNWLFWRLNAQKVKANEYSS
jgi:hypothetical protein